MFVKYKISWIVQWERAQWAKKESAIKPLKEGWREHLSPYLKFVKKD